MAQVNGPESGISCMIQFVADSPDGEFRARITAPTESNNVLDTASFSSLDDAISWIGKVFPEQTVRWKANRLFALEICYGVAARSALGALRRPGWPRNLVL